MALTKIFLENFTVFNKIEIKFMPGINVFIGENGTGKTHVMKLLYSACQAAQIQATAVDFPQKIVKVFRPDDFNIGRLVSRSVGNGSSKVHVSSDSGTIKTSFERRTKRWEAKVTGKQA
jgi:recombinational DNA repair ATPase RecF